ncbi:MAG TPA: hypothetical protein VMQ58_02325 [Candidatus Saccharimonadales bacterium]|nr:hypothetical protein [Candidatus Saccharimonadales bacterium]
MNKLWHEQHKLPKNATEEERLKWHIEHQKQCGCRPIPKSLQKQS